jgi:hypothetical protein
MSESGHLSSEAAAQSLALPVAEQLQQLLALEFEALQN